MNKFTKRILALIAVSVLMLGCVSCESRPITSTKQAMSVVGTVGEYDVTYEEFYALEQNYREQLDAKYEGAEISEQAYLDELKELVRNNIVTNYAVLTLAQSNGVQTDSEELDKVVQTALDTMIARDFGGSRSEYKKSLKKNGLTDSYVRFSLKVDAIYSKLITLFLDNGVIKSDNDYVKEYIKTEFARTWHIMIVNDGTDESHARIKEAKDLIDSGRSMYDMIGSKYNEDFMLTTLDGYYFPKGTMDEVYEKAVFELEIGEISDIVASEGRNSSGETVDCYYIIQRLEPEDGYINKNFESLKEQYYSAAIYDMVNNLQESLEFVPNDHGASLDLLNLKAPRTVDYVVVVTVVSVLVAIAVVVVISLLLVRKIKKKNADLIGTRSQKELRAPRNKG